MAEIIFTDFIFTIIQLSGAYLRYLPFSRDISQDKLFALKKWFILLSFVSFALYLWIIISYGLSYFTYKIILLVWWMPYFLISPAIIGKLPQHIFVFGMQGLWCFMLHAFAGTTVAFIHGTMAEEFLPLQITFYLIFFFVLLPIERKFFIELLPTQRFFEDKALKWCISILPMALFIGTIIPMLEVTFLTTWNGRISRWVIPVFCLLIYRSLNITTKRIEEKNLQEQKNRLLERQMNSLAENNLLMEKNQREVTELQKKLSENYIELEKLIDAGKIPDAMKFISRQVEILDSTRIKKFSRLPLINAAISIYFRRAEKLGIKITSTIDLPNKILTDESDLAVLLSNLLENAITASKKISSGREISLILRHKDGQNILEITNRYDKKIKIGENGLPYSKETGHGLGMISLEMFIKKYDAFADFSQENEIVQLSLYWNDHLRAK